MLYSTPLLLALSFLSSALATATGPETGAKTLADCLKLNTPNSKHFNWSANLGKCQDINKSCPHNGRLASTDPSSKLPVCGGCNPTGFSLDPTTGNCNPNKKKKNGK